MDQIDVIARLCACKCPPPSHGPSYHDNIATNMTIELTVTKRPSRSHSFVTNLRHSKLSPLKCVLR